MSRVLWAHLLDPAFYATIGSITMAFGTTVRLTETPAALRSLMNGRKVDVALPFAQHGLVEHR